MIFSMNESFPECANEISYEGAFAFRQVNEALQICYEGFLPTDVCCQLRGQYSTKIRDDFYNYTFP